MAQGKSSRGKCLWGICYRGENSQGVKVKEGLNVTLVVGGCRGCVRWDMSWEGGVCGGRVA